MNTSKWLHGIEKSKNMGEMWYGYIMTSADWMKNSANDERDKDKIVGQIKAF